MEDTKDDTQARLIEAMAHVGRIEKDKKNTHQGYMYLSEEAVKVGVQKALAASGVRHSRIEMAIISDEWVKIGKGMQNLIKMRATIHFPDGSSYEGLGGSSDYGDKAMMQAQTAALREAWKNVFVIPTGSDPEEKSPEQTADPSPRPAKQGAGRGVPTGRQGATPAAKAAPGDEQLTMEQRTKIKALFGEKGFTLAQGTLACTKVMKVSPVELTVTLANEFIQWLNEYEPTGGA